MSIPHFFLDDQIIADETREVFPLRLSKNDVKHAHVLRLRPGEHIAAIDAVKDYFECEIVSIDGDVVQVRIARHLDIEDDEPRVVLVQGIAKGDKVDEVIRHATEIGVSAFVPLECDRSIVKLDAKKRVSRTERWRSIAKSAAMQSGRTFIPEVAEPAVISDIETIVKGATATLVCWEESDGSVGVHEAISNGCMQLGVTDRRDTKVVVVVGPEGGLTSDEVKSICSFSKRAYAVSLGPSIMRTETAGVVASALVIYELGGLGNSKHSREQMI